MADWTTTPKFAKTETTERYDLDFPQVVEDILGVLFEVTTVMFTTVHDRGQGLDTRLVFWGYPLKKDGTRAANAMFQAILLDAAGRMRMETDFQDALGRLV